MKPVLIDTSLWIEFFSKRPSISTRSLDEMKSVILDGNAVIIEPIRAELLSGHIVPKQRSEIVLALDALEKVDLDWSLRITWDDIIQIADVAKTNRLRIPGIIDRMILLAALTSNVQLASCDKALVVLANELNIDIWQGL